mgnify:CR=1 FL=1
MHIDIHTDASFNLTYKSGAYAFSIVHKDFRITYSDKFRESPTSSTEAEGWCVINAIIYFLKNVYAYHHVTSVTIYNDNVNIIDGFSCPIGKVRNPPKLLKEKLRWMLEGIFKKRKLALNIQYQWVKGHQEVTVSESAKENKWCDKACAKAVAGRNEHQIEFFRDIEYARTMKFGAKIKRSYI